MYDDIRRRALWGDTTILEEYTEEQLGEELDNNGWNAFHILAQVRKTQILKYLTAYKLRNKAGKTAVEILLKNLEVTREVIEKLFPWYTPYGDETIEESLEKIKETSNAEKFILSL